MSETNEMSGKIDRTRPHYEFCHGPANDDPSDWEVVVRFVSEPDGTTTYEPAEGVSNDEFERAVRSICASIREVGRFDMRRPNGCIDASMRNILASRGNWYGDTHFRYAAGE